MPCGNRETDSPLQGREGHAMPENIMADANIEQPEAAAPQPAPTHEEKLFTDAYVKARIDKQRGKFEEQLAERDSRLAELEEQLAKTTADADALRKERERAAWLEQASAATGIDRSIIRGDSLEEMMQHAEAIKAATTKFPTLPDEGKPAASRVTLADIANIEDDRERREAIKEYYKNQ